MEDIGLYIAGVSALAAILALGLSFKGTRRTDDRDKAQSAGQLTRIETTLELVRGGIEEIRAEMKGQQLQINDVSQRVARMEGSAKTSERRIDMIEGRMSNECKD